MMDRVVAGILAPAVAATANLTMPKIVQLAIGVAFFMTGVMFLTLPVTIGNALGLGMIDGTNDGVIEVQAFYGGMEIGLGLFLVVAPTEPALLCGFMLLLFTGVTRMWSFTNWNGFPGKMDHTLLHFAIGFVEASSSFLCLQARMMEKKRVQLLREKKEYFSRVQSPNPKKLADFVPFCEANLENPFPFLKALRDEAPVYRVPYTDYWMVSRYADLVQIAKNTDAFSSNLVQFLLGTEKNSSAMERPAFARGIGITDVLALIDPPEHTNHRKVALTGLNAKLFREMETSIRAKVIQMLGNLAEEAKITPEGIDWVTQFAIKLPMTVALEVCGMPTEDHVILKSFADHAVALLNHVNTPQEFAAHTLEAKKLLDFVAFHFDLATKKYRSSLSNGSAAEERMTIHSTPFLNALIAATDPPEGSKVEKISSLEARSMIIQVLLAGNDSSASTMGSCVHLLGTRKDLQDALRADMTRIPDFIEETLRIESPFVGQFRKVRSPGGFTLDSGVHLPEGTRVQMLWQSGNRDERHFPDPDTFQMDRQNAKTHLSFGFGIHTCLGSTLAKLEIRIVLEELLSLFSSIELVPGQEIKHVKSTFIRALEHLRVKLH